MAVQRRTVTGDTPRRRAACCTLRNMARNLSDRRATKSMMSKFRPRSLTQVRGGMCAGKRRASTETMMVDPPGRRGGPAAGSARATAVPRKGETMKVLQLGVGAVGEVNARVAAQEPQVSAVVLADVRRGARARRGGEAAAGQGGDAGARRVRPRGAGARGEGRRLRPQRPRDRLGHPGHGGLSRGRGELPRHGDRRPARDHRHGRPRRAARPRRRVQEARPHGAWSRSASTPA